MGAAPSMSRLARPDPYAPKQGRQCKAARATAAAQLGATDVSRDLTTFFEVSLDMLCIRDRAFRFVKVNQAWEVALGYSIADLEGAPMLSFIHPDDASASHGHMQRLEVEEEVFGFTNRYRHRDGNYRHLEWRARRVGDLVFGVARDVTERLAIEAEMLAARAAAEAANQSKSEFLANMSHEIRTPLNGVIGLAAALGRTDLTPGQREMVGLIETSGVTLERLVSDVLDVSKIEAGRLEIETRAFDIRAETADLLEVYRRRAEDKGLNFDVEYGPHARGHFLGDSVRLKQVLGNLLSNAVKFTAEGGISLRVHIRDAAPAGDATRLVLEVRDTGVGFDATFAGDLFQRFSQADGTITRRFGGSGLGLSITRSLVELMGGEIRAESEAGQGSTFRVDLPLVRHRPMADSDAAGALARTASLEASRMERLASLRILLVEDHPVNQRVVQLILGPFGVELVTAGNGVEALEAFSAGVFDLVLMDMQMPVMDGLSATRAIREREALTPGRARTPVLMLSANAMRQHQEAAAASGADGYLAKPVTVASLIDGIMDTLDTAGRPSMQDARSGVVARPPA
jgi:two-component system, sensor histidine kinase